MNCFSTTYQHSVMLPEFVVILHIGTCYTGPDASN